jgi:glycerophosphoryl diester phosphodiesterase
MRPIGFAMLVVLALATGCGDTQVSHPGPGRAATGPVGIAHRGASGRAPEHTHAAYDLALELGADYIEHDLQQTADGVLVILHDETLDRTARGPTDACSGPVGGKTLAQLRNCDFGIAHSSEFAGERIVTLDELMERHGIGTRYYIETKHPEASEGMERSLVELLRRHGQVPARGDPPGVIVQSFSTASLEQMRMLAPGIPRVRLLERGELGEDRGEALAAVASYANGIGPNLADVDAELVALAHERGLFVHPWTVNETDDLERMIGLGVDGVFTDHIDRFVELTRGDRQQQPVR